MKKRYFAAAVLALGFLASCAEEPIGSTPMDSIAPGQVTDIEVVNVPGGADITFTIPRDSDLLYVKGSYVLENGKQAEVMVSFYDNTLKIRGFAKAMDHVVEVVAGDRSGNESRPVKVIISPLRSPIFDVLESINLRSTFGGVSFTWENATKSPIGITLLKRQGDAPFEEINTYYSESSNGRIAARGMDAEEADFAYLVKDRWDNVTDTLMLTLTPLYEEQFPVGTYQKYTLAGDSDIAYGWDLRYALDGELQEYGWFSKPTVEGGNWPAVCTVRIPRKAMLSRIKLRQRYGEMWENGNPKKFTVWATNNPSPDGSYDSWTPLKTFTSVKPSGFGSGQYSDEDIYVAKNGEDFEFDGDDSTMYEFYRFEFLENWGGDNTFINLLELWFFGQLGNN